MPAWVAPAIAAVGGLVGQWWNNRQQRKAYREQQDYNTPAAQMQRYKEAGLSPYLIYGQGNSGNMSSPPPSYQYDSDFIGKGMGNYMSFKNFDMNQRLMNAQLQGMRTDNLTKDWIQGEKFSNMLRKNLELLSDYPDLNISHVQETGKTGFAELTGFRRQSNILKNKIQELKLAATKVEIDRMQAMIKNLDFKNVTESVRAKYAQDYGMVGGDWTQGLGLLKSLPSLFRGARKIPENERALINTYRKFKGDQYKRDANRFLFEQLK